MKQCVHRRYPTISFFLWNSSRIICEKNISYNFKISRDWPCFSMVLTYWAIKPWVQLALRANFVQLLQFHLFVQCSRFISTIAFVSRHICFKRNLAQVITWLQRNELIKMVFTTETFWEVAIESWHEWDLNPRPLNSVQTLKPTELSGHEFNSPWVQEFNTWPWVRHLYI